MKRKLVLMLVFLYLLAIPAFGQGLPMVVDEAELLNASEEEALQEMAEKFREEFAMDAVILTVDSMGGKLARDYADDYYDSHGYGVGESYSGLLLLVSMRERELYISTCGDAIPRLSDDELDTIIGGISYYLSSGEYYTAFETFFSMVPLYAETIDGYKEDAAEEPSVNWLLSVLIGLVTAAVALVIMRSSMNTKRPQYSAGDYVKAGSYDLYRRHDMFLYSQVSKVRKQQNNGGGHGGASVHRSSSGRSHGGRGGRF